ncbi:unnamed protein product, partial [marine sediment metagenome]
MLERLKNALRRRKGWLIVVALMSALGAGLLCVLLFSNPQWHKYVYLFQLKVRSEAHKEKMKRPPSGYTGIWRTWERGNPWDIEDVGLVQANLVCRDGRVQKKIRYYREGKGS